MNRQIHRITAKRSILSLLCFLALCATLLTISGCNDHSVSSTIDTNEGLEQGFKASDPLVALSTVELFQRLLCPRTNDPTIPKPDINKKALLDSLKNQLESKSDWERLQALETMIICQAEGINGTVIDQFRIEKDPDVRQQIVELVALDANIPLQREIASRTLRSNDPITKRYAYNLIFDPYYAAQAALKDESRRQATADRLAAEFESSYPLIAAKNLRHLRDLGNNNITDKLLETAKDPSQPANDRINAVATLALAGTPEAAPLFEEIVNKDAFPTSKKKKSAPTTAAEVSKLVRYAKLGQIAIQDRPIDQLSRLTDKDQQQHFEAIEVLLANNTEEALNKVIDWLSQETPLTRHYIVSSIFAGNDWTIPQIADIFLKSTPTDRLLILKYLKQKEGKQMLDVLQTAFQKATPEQSAELIEFIRHQMLTPAEVKRFISLIPALEAWKKNDNTPALQREEISTILQLIQAVQTKKLPPISEIEKMPFNDRFQFLLIGAQLGKLSQEERQHLKKEDNYFLQLIPKLYPQATP